MTDLRILRDLGFTPEIATELGHMCVAWAALEYRLFALYHLLSDMPVPLARASFYAHHSTRNRTELILSTAAMVLRGSQKREAAYAALEKLFKSIKRTAGKRNAYIHDPWGMIPGDMDSVCQLRLSGKDIHGEGQHVNGKDLSQLSDQIVSLTRRVHAFDSRVDPMLSASLGKFDRTRSVTLAFARTGRRRTRRQAHQEEPSPLPEASPE
jgi:hypothetical protein